MFYDGFVAEGIAEDIDKSSNYRLCCYDEKFKINNYGLRSYIYFKLAQSSQNDHVEYLFSSINSDEFLRYIMCNLSKDENFKKQCLNVISEIVTKFSKDVKTAKDNGDECNYNYLKKHLELLKSYFDNFDFMTEYLVTFEKGSCSRIFRDYIFNNAKNFEKIIKIADSFFVDKSDKLNKIKMVKAIDVLCEEFELHDEIYRDIILLLILGIKNNRDVANYCYCSVEKMMKYMDKLMKIGIIYGTSHRKITTACLFHLDKLCNGSKCSFVDSLLTPYDNSKIDDIELSDYSPSIQKQINYVIELIKNHKDKSPMNILLYGVSGSGKSSIVSCLSKIINKRHFSEIKDSIISSYYSSYENNEDDDDEDDYFCEKEYVENQMYNSSAIKRLLNLKICSNIAIPTKSVFVIDECDDTINSSNGADFWLTGKRMINDLLDNNNIPTIWITNHIHMLDQSTLRRFQYSIKFEKFGVNQRIKAWNKQIELCKLNNLFDNNIVSSLASKYNITAGAISNIVKNVKSIKSSIKKDEIFNVVCDFANNYCSLVGNSGLDSSNLPYKDNYSLDGLNIDSNFSLDKIESCVKNYYVKLNNNEPVKNLNILLNGPMGTGKTEYAKYLSRALDIPLICKTYGELSSMWVGECEKNIISMFNEAEDSRSILFVDEADSLIQSRSSSKNSWELTQVNEFITRMERFKGVLICATNFVDKLDLASVRRFSFKIKFDYLDNNGKIIFWKKFFNVPISDERTLFNIDMLTPGDFKVVSDKIEYCGDFVDFNFIIDELSKEVSFKKKYETIGF